MRWLIEYTDTFGGDANYSWVQRSVLEDTDGKLTERALVRRAKAQVGLNGVRGLSLWYGDTYEFRPYDRATVLFMTPMEDE